MSLKTFHIVFIALSVLLCAGVSIRMLTSYAHGQSLSELLLGSVAALAGIGLILYGIHFLKKLRHVHFL